MRCATANLGVTIHDGPVDLSVMNQGPHAAKNVRVVSWVPGVTAPLGLVEPVTSGWTCEQSLLTGGLQIICTIPTLNPNQAGNLYFIHGDYNNGSTTVTSDTGDPTYIMSGGFGWTYTY